jgi:hypothetical protein
MESNFDTERTLLLKESNIFEPKSYLSGINSGSGKGVPEISIEGIVHAEELRELIRTMVRVCSGGDGTGSGGTVTPQAVKPAEMQQVLEELRAIRALLEKKL